MKHLLLGILLLLTQVAWAQPAGLQQKVRLSSANLSVKKTFAEIETQTGLVFSYSNGVPLQQILEFKKNKGRLHYFLDVFAAKTPFSYRLRGEKVLIFRPGEPIPIAATAADSDQKYTISGYFRDANTDEELLYGRVSVLETGSGVVGNEYGYYALSLPAGEYNIRFSYLGYIPQTLHLHLETDQKKNLKLISQAVRIKTVKIDEVPEPQRLHENESGEIGMAVTDLKKIPVVLGESDILKSLQLLPGISGANEGGSSLFVRGGNGDENLLLLDEATVYNPAHLLSFFSVFNSDALKDVRIYKAAVPTKFGGRASSVFDIRMKEGNRNKVSGSGGVGLLASRLAIQGPVFRKKGTFLATARRSYIDVLLHASPKPDLKNTILYFQDINLKFSYKFSDQDRIFISTYGGEDRLAASKSPIGLYWNNKTISIRWNHLFSDRLFSNTSVIGSSYQYEFKLVEDSLTFRVMSGIGNINIKEDFTWFPNASNQVRFGLSLESQDFLAGKFTLGTPVKTVEEVLPRKQSGEVNFYAGNEQHIGQKLVLNYGFRANLFGLYGPDTTFTYDSEGLPLAMTAHPAGIAYKYYGGISPRFSGRWQLGERSSLKGSFSQLRQNVHKIGNSATNLPTDFWAPASFVIPPLITRQVSIGYFQNLFQNRLEFSLEAFWKTSKNQIDYKDGANIFFNKFFESDLVLGIGRAKGLEFLLRKPKGRLAGWIAYTLSRTERKFPAINGGNWYSARQDRTHDISLVLTYQLNENLQANLNWVYYTGDAVTYPSGKYTVDGNVLNYYTERNGYRFPDYHRLDLGLTWNADRKGPFTQDFIFSIYNVYARKNAFSIVFEKDPAHPGQPKAVKVALFSLVPSITWNFKF